MECSINNPALSLMMKHLVIGQRLKTPHFSAFHWSSRSSLVSIGQHFVATRVVHFPKSTEASLITESDRSGPNHQLSQLRTARTAWFDSDRAVLAVHSCNSWSSQIFCSNTFKRSTVHTVKNLNFEIEKSEQKLFAQISLSVLRFLLRTCHKGL